MAIFTREMIVVYVLNFQISKQLTLFYMFLCIVNFNVNTLITNKIEEKNIHSMWNPHISTFSHYVMLFKLALKISGL